VSRRSVVLYAAHYVTEELLADYAAMRDACAGRYDVVLLYDNFHGDFPDGEQAQDVDVHLVNPESIASLGYSPWPGMQPSEYGSPSGLRPGNTDFAVLDFFRARPGYDSYWRVEYDVRFSGDWRDFFDACSSSEADLLGTTLLRCEASPAWHWWASLGAPDGRLDPAKAIRGFFPVSRLTNRACALLDQKYREGWHGHIECVVPTALVHHGMRVEDIGGRGEFVPPGHEDRFYTNTPSDPCLHPGTFVFRPAFARPGSRRNTLWHPVRNDADGARWVRTCADRGLPVAQFRMGVMLAKGDGVAVDLPGAYFWHALAASRGHEPAAKWRDEVAALLTPSEMRTVEERLRHWMPTRPRSGGATA
jgi:hypothetical protein